MRDYLLFIDTECSGLPRRWDAPYSEESNWPYSLQVAWVIYTKDGQEVKWENHYIKDDDFKISPSAYKIHRITREFLLKNGKSRREVMTLLADDVLKYQPLIVGHFLQLDIHMAAVDFYRANIENPLKNLPSFCTMLASSVLVKNPRKKYLRLPELYDMLFNTILVYHHNAIVDVRATAECFFELVKRGYINDEVIEQQQIKAAPPPAATEKPGCIAGMLVFFILMFVIFYL